MTKALKGALLSALVFPGLGQVFLKQYKRGLFLMLMVFSGLLAIVVIAVQQAFAILEKIESKGGMIDMNAILNAAAQASSPSSGLMISTFSLLILIGWIVGTVDAYRIGKKQDLEGDL